MIQARVRRWWNSCRWLHASLAILSLPIVAVWSSRSAVANGPSAFTVPVSDPPAPYASGSFDDLSDMHGQAGMPAHVASTAEGIVYEGEVDACGPGDPQAPGCGHARRCRKPSDAPGLFQQLHAHHLESGACLKFRGDSLLLWRDAPAARQLVVAGGGAGTPFLDADQLQSTATGGVRTSLVRLDGCTGNGWEAGYFYAGAFTAQRALPFVDGTPYAIAPSGIYGNNGLLNFNSGSTSLLGRLQSAECNRLLALGPNVRWLTGFRWLQWREQFGLTTTVNDGMSLVDQSYQTGCLNNLYGGQIGADARLLTLGRLRVDSLVKAGAYYNAASQSSTYTVVDAVDPTQSGSESIKVTQSPAACSFVGEVGMTGVMPLTENLDFRVGYVGLWLTGLAQPTNQLSGQQLPTGGPIAGTLTANGGVFVQGLSLGLEGRW